ncbi:MAG: hypothetical protein U0105_06745 [Candidatus Obscuribacterales bacterium]
MNLFLIGGITLLWAALLLIVRRLIREKALGTSPVSLPVVGNEGELRPAELAYLVRDGDMTHTMIVMALDLIQRAVKSQTATNVGENLAPYEMEIWQRVKSQVRGWAEKKVNEVNPLATVNPAEVLRRLNAIKVFFTTTVGRFLQDVVRDPKRIKGYFTLTGILRVVADLTRAGYGAVIEQDMRNALLSRGLIVEESQRTRGGTFSLVAAGVSFVLMIAACLLLQGLTEPAVYATFMAACGGAFFSAVILRALLMVPQFVPFYEEISLVLSEASRSSWQVVALRTVFGLARLIAWSLFAVTILIILGIASLVFSFAMHAEVGGALLALFAASVWWMTFMQLLIDAHGLIMRENKTLRAERQVEKAKQEIKHATALGTLKDVFANPDYDPTFSNLVAVYGVETIWLLTK